MRLHLEYVQECHMLAGYSVDFVTPETIRFGNVRLFFRQKGSRSDSRSRQSLNRFILGGSP